MNSNVLFTLFGISLILLLQTDFINADGGDDGPDVEADSDESGPIFGDVSVPDVHNNDTDGPQHLDFNEEDTSNEEGPSLSEGVSDNLGGNTTATSGPQVFGDNKAKSSWSEGVSDPNVNTTGTNEPEVFGDNEGGSSLSEGVSELGDNISGMDGPQIGDNERGSSFSERVSEFGDNINGTDGPQVFGDNEEENEGVSDRLGGVSAPNGQNTFGIEGVPNLDTNINGMDENSDAGFDTRTPTSDDGMPESDGHPKGLTSGHLTKKLKGIAKTLKRMQKSLSDFFSSLGR
ncbi:hypothetical protein Ddc_17328 [Ditylenchus destructor]|nr:hypothetical protein Ddc_17328 [Ditylenchus destructor]